MILNLTKDVSVARVLGYLRKYKGEVWIMRIWMFLAYGNLQQG